MAGMITDLSSIGSIDRTADLLEIVDLSANTSFKVTVNALVGISGGNVVSTTDSQTVQNKTIDNTNSLAVKDTLFTLQDDGDATKQAQFQLSGISAGTTRVYTLPNASGTLVDLASAQTLTNKVLTAPTINGGIVDNITLTVDAVSGHTSATIVTIANLQVSNGVLNTTNSVKTSNLQTNSVTADKLDTAAIKLGSVSGTTLFNCPNSAIASQVTSMTLTVTVPAGSRFTEVIYYCPGITNNSAARGLTMSLWDGVVNSGTQLQTWHFDPYVASANTSCYMYWLGNPAAGSKTYNIGMIMNTQGDNGQLNPAATNPQFLVCKAL